MMYGRFIKSDCRVLRNTSMGVGLVTSNRFREFEYIRFSCFVSETKLQDERCDNENMLVLSNSMKKYDNKIF